MPDDAKPEVAPSLALRPDRGVVAVTGADAAEFLNGVVTNTVKGLAPGEARLGALLSPQGKVLFDFFLVAVADGFLIEIDRAVLPDFVKRLGLYRLRAKVAIADVSDAFAVAVAWRAPPAAIAGATGFTDPRLPDLGHHLLVPRDGAPAPTAALADWHALRIGLGVPESGRDFALGDVFPHDVDMDDLAGVDFRKGCFVGQEVVSRMKHRGTARRRAVLAHAREARPAWPDAGTEIVCAERTVGTLGSAHGATALALVRLDRAREALDSGDPIEVGGVTVTLELPAFAHFDWPAGSSD